MIKKVVLIIVGVSLSIVGLGLLAAGSFLLIAPDSDGYLSSGKHRIDTATHALVSPEKTIQSNAWTSWAYYPLGTPHIRVQAQSTNDRPIFLGLGPAADVDRYLTGVAIDEVTNVDFSPYRLTKQLRPGDRLPAPPVTQRFWSAQATGADQQALTWPVQSGTYRLVVMNPLGGPGVDVQGSLAVGIPHAFGLGVGLVIAGVVALAGGIALLRWGVKTRTRPGGPATTRGGPVPAGAAPPYQPGPPNQPGPDYQPDRGNPPGSGRTSAGPPGGTGEPVAPPPDPFKKPPGPSPQ